MAVAATRPRSKSRCERLGGREPEPGGVDQQRPAAVRPDDGVAGELLEDDVAALAPDAGRGGDVGVGVGRGEGGGHRAAGRCRPGTRRWSSRRARCRPDRRGRHDPADPPADHPQLLGRGADGDHAVGQPAGARRGGRAARRRTGCVPSPRRRASMRRAARARPGRRGARGRTPRPVGIAGPISSTAAVPGPTAAASRSGSVRQPSGLGLGGHVDGYGAGQPYPVDQPGVDGVGQHHLGARLAVASSALRIAVEPAGDAHALARRVVRAPADAADVRGRGRRSARWPSNGR